MEVSRRHLPTFMSYPEHPRGDGVIFSHLPSMARVEEIRHTNLLHAKFIRYQLLKYKPYAMRTFAVTHFIVCEPYPTRAFTCDPLLSTFSQYKCFPCRINNRNWLFLFLMFFSVSIFVKKKKTSPYISADFAQS